MLLCLGHVLGAAGVANVGVRGCCLYIIGGCIIGLEFWAMSSPKYTVVSV